jgi:TolB-like protein
MSPEQWQGLTLDARSDVYSFGLVVQELLAGRRMESDPTLPRTLPPLPADVPAELRTIVAKALEQDPADRYQSMRDLVVDLRRVARRSEAEAGRVLPRWRSPLGYAAALMAVLIVGLLAREYVRDAFAPSRSAVAVLPFASESSNVDDASITERLGDKLRDRLQELPDLDVIGRVSSVNVRDQQADLRTIAAALGVGRLVNGSLQRRGAMLDVRVEIVDERGVILRALSYEEPDTALVALQQKMSDEVSAYLVPASAAPATAPTALPSQSEAANKLILFGSRLDNAVKDDAPLIDEDKLQKAIDFYRRATRADPSSIEAYSRLAAALLYNRDGDGAGVALRRALELGQTLGANAKSTDLSRAYYTAGLYLIGTRSEGPEDQYERALELNPNNVDALGSYAQWLMSHNRSFEADAYFKEAIRREPQSLLRYADYAEYLGIRDEIEPLRDLAREIEQRFPNARGYLKLAHVYELTGDFDVGIAYGLMGYRLLASQGAAPNQNATSQAQLVEDAHGQLMELYARIGDFDQASKFERDAGIGQLLLRREYDKLVELAQDRVIERPDDLDTQYYLAFAYNATGDFQTAKYLLEQLRFPIEEFAPISGTESQASTYYVDALQSLGGNDAVAKDLARKREETFATGARTGMGKSSWVNVMLTCSESQLGRIPEAIAAIDRVSAARGLPSLPLLQDSPCFKRLAKEPRYIALIEHLKDRQKELRERLPATLAKYGVADVQP